MCDVPNASLGALTGAVLGARRRIPHPDHPADGSRQPAEERPRNELETPRFAAGAAQHAAIGLRVSRAELEIEASRLGGVLEERGQRRADQIAHALAEQLAARRVGDRDRLLSTESQQ